MLYFFDVLGPSLLDEHCRTVACFAVACCCESVPLLRRPQFFLLLSPSFVGPSLSSLSSWRNSWILSSPVSERVFFWTIVIVIVS